MTIASFCRTELLAHGPLTLDDLAERASRAGVTRARDPRSSVRSAITYSELRLTGERWVSPMWLLEGRFLTTRGFGDDEWPYRLDESRYDLGLLRMAATLAPIPLVEGGTLSHRSSYNTLTCSGRLPEPTPDELLCLHVVGGSVKASVVAAEMAPTPEATRLAQGLNARPVPSSYSYDTESKVLTRLGQLLLADDTLLRSPAPPLTACSEALADLRAHDEKARQHAMRPVHEDPFLTVRLYPEIARELEDLAWSEGMLPVEWVERQVLRAAAGREALPSLRLIQ